MYIQTHTKRVGEKTYQSVLLVEGYRDNGKVKHRTLANLSALTPEMIEEMKKILKGAKALSLDELETQQGKSCGALIVIREICKRLGIIKALGNSASAILSIVLIMGRIITQGSRLHLAESFQKDQALAEVLGVGEFNEDELYQTLIWLADNQSQIEQTLFKSRHIEPIEEIFLYDVTSSYLEGQDNELAQYGYNRDGKKGKKQLVIGLLTDKEGYPVSIEVFTGNTSDPKTVSSQLKKLKDLYGVKKVVFVGDRGMLKGAQISELLAHNDNNEDFSWHYITAITKSQIETLIKKDVLQLGLFDNNLAEVESDGVRYVFRRNPIQAQLIADNRASKIQAVIKLVDKSNNYLLLHPKAKLDTALNNILIYIKKLNLSDNFTITTSDREIFISTLNKDYSLDGCYVLKTDLPSSVADKQVIHNRYKDLAKVEWAFRTIKTSIEEIRPVFLRKEKQTRGHVFVCMLSYMVLKYLSDHLKDLDFTRSFVIDTLDKISFLSFNFNGHSIKRLPSSLLPHQQLILDRLHIKLPSSL
jgi:transposase